MKIPRKPLDYVALIGQIAKTGRLPELLLKVGQSLDADYLHWDQLRRRPPPSGLSSEEWWFVVRTARNGAAKSLPLVDTRNEPFIVVPSHDKVVEALHHIDTRMGVVVKLDEPVANATKRDAYVLRSLIAEAITSSQLEGAVTTREVAQAMLETKRAPRDESEKMIYNNFVTMQRIQELRDRDLTPELVFELHALVTHEALDKVDGAGRFRRADEDIAVVDSDDQVLHQPPPAAELPERLEAMCAFANGKTPSNFIHPVVRAVALHFWLAWDHPFVDGNGRTARALFYWCMLKQGYWLIEYISISEVIRKASTQYGQAYLWAETDSNDFTYFLIYHLKVIQTAVDGLHAYFDAQVTRTRSARERLSAVSAWCNARQFDILERLIESSQAVTSIAEHQALHGIVYETARTDLMELVERGLVQKFKAGRKLVFRATPDIDRHLRGPDGPVHKVDRR